MLRQQRSIGIPARPAAQRQEDLVDVAEVRARVFDAAAKILEGLALGLQDRSDPAIERQATKVEAPGDPNAAQIALERTRKRRRCPECSRA